MPELTWKTALEEHFVTPDFNPYFETKSVNISPERFGQAYGTLRGLGDRRPETMDAAGDDLSVLTLPGSGIHVERDADSAIRCPVECDEFLAEEMRDLLNQRVLSGQRRVHTEPGEGRGSRRAESRPTGQPGRPSKCVTRSQRAFRPSQEPDGRFRQPGPAAGFRRRLRSVPEHQTDSGPIWRNGALSALAVRRPVENLRCEGANAYAGAAGIPETRPLDHDDGDPFRRNASLCHRGAWRESDPVFGRPHVRADAPGR